MRYGFRVFEVTLREGNRGRTPLLWQEPIPDEEHHRDRLEELTRAHLLGRTVFCQPNLDRMGQDPDDAQHGDPLMRVVTVNRGSGRLSVSARYGYKGEFDAGVREDGSEIDLHDMAAASTFRAELFVPEDGLTALLAVETISNRCPVSMLTRWWGRLSYENGEFIKVVANQTVDGDRMREILRQSERVEIELSSRGRERDGNRRAKSTKLIHEVTDQDAKGSLFSLAGDLASENRGFDVHTVEAIAGFEPEKLDEAGLRFENVALVVSDNNGKNRKVLRPERIRAMFTYPLSHEFQASDQAWDHAVTDKIRHLSADRDIFRD
jgi:hypothetical protein